METVNAGKPLYHLIRWCYAANRPVLLVGGHGIGKSEMLEQSAVEMGIGFICRDLSLMEPPDLLGLPKVSGRRTIYLPPSFLPSSGRGLLVFEELNRSDRHMRAPCLQLLTARMLNDYRLPQGWLPVAAINPPDAEYEVDELDAALLSRFVQVRVVADRTEWLEWARRNNIHSQVIHYVEQERTAFDSPESNPRAWKYVSDLLWQAEKEQTARPVVRAGILGLVGDIRGAVFMATLQAADTPFSAAEVLSSYPQHRSQLQGWIKKGKLDLVNTTLLNVEKHLQPSADYEVTRRSRRKWANLATFFADLPGDLQESAARMFQERGYMWPQAVKRRTKVIVP